MDDIAGWIAPIATMIAAMMTAANLGARVTGWGFVVFTVGSISWSIIGYASGQTNLIATNLFLTLVNVVGIWRWLGRQRAYEDGGKSAVGASQRVSGPTLFTATGLAGLPVIDSTGEDVGKAVEALLESETGQINYVVIASGGVGGIQESLRAVPREQIAFSSERLTLAIQAPAFMALPALADGNWPEQAAA